jgi:voltage-gated potassium channel
MKEPNVSIEPLPKRSAMPVYHIFMLTLCVLALGGLIAQNAVAQDDETQTILVWADTAICIAFGIDFLISLWRAPNRLRYFMTWGWLDLLSFIPLLDVTRWGRLARIARIVRLLRGLRAARVLSTAILKGRKQSTLLAAALLSLVLVFASSIAILHFETDKDRSIKTAEDALWWSLTTITTVGYGDKYPISSEGRFIAALLMTAGVGLFGVISAGLAAFFLAPQQDDAAQDLRAELESLRRAVEELTARTAATGHPPGSSPTA